MRLEFSEADKNNTGRFLSAAAGLLLGISWFFVVLSVFGLTWSPAEAFDGGMAQGLVNVWNAAADRLGTADYILIGKYSVSGGGTGLFLTSMLAVSAAAAVLAVKSRVRPLLLIFILPPALTALVFRLPPSYQTAVVFAAACVFAAVVMSKRTWEKRDTTSAAAFTAVTLAVSLSVSAAVDSQTGFTLPEAVSSAGEKTVSYINDVRYGTDSLRHGELDSLNGRKTGKGTALTITMTKPESMYLRGFTGERYTGSSWENLGNDSYYAMHEKLYWLGKKGFSGSTQLYTSASTAASGETQKKLTAADHNRISVTVKNADRRCLYTPYELSAIPDEGKSTGGSWLMAGGLTVAREYSYTACGSITSAWTSWTGRLYSQKSEKAKELFVTESHYNVLQYRYYTKIPGSTKRLIAKGTGLRPDGGKNHVGYKTAISEVRKYLDDNFVYSENFRAIDSDKDFVKNFTAARKGCDVHYATMAVLMFRYLGIPSRFVEGYLITPDDVKGVSAGEKIDVKASAIHAWPEIYVDGLGWVPVEVTPKYRGVMKEADMTRGLETLEQKHEQNTRRSAAKQPEDKQQTEHAGQVWKYVGIIMLLMLCAALLAFVIRLIAARLIRRRRRIKAFNDPDPDAAVCAIYQYMMDEGLGISEKAAAVGDMAAFSRRKAGENDRQFMIGEYKREKEEKKRERKESKKRRRRGHRAGDRGITASRGMQPDA
ncbi:MAG: transglutaminase family protein [Anaerovoracaceae bacterium]